MAWTWFCVCSIRVPETSALQERVQHQINIFRPLTSLALLRTSLQSYCHAVLPSRPLRGTLKLVSELSESTDTTSASKNGFSTCCNRRQKARNETFLKYPASLVSFDFSIADSKCTPSSAWMCFEIKFNEVKIQSVCGAIGLDLKQGCFKHTWSYIWKCKNTSADYPSVYKKRWSQFHKYM